MATRLNSGALPVPITLVSQQTIGASLGAESLAKSLKAGVYGLILVALFMILFYRLPGVVSVVALAVYILIVLAIYKLIPVTLTLAGIAGFILSLGMAVDANILIFARMREELKSGKTPDEFHPGRIPPSLAAYPRQPRDDSYRSGGSLYLYHFNCEGFRVNARHRSSREFVYRDNRFQVFSDAFYGSEV